LAIPGALLLGLFATVIGTSIKDKIYYKRLEKRMKKREEIINTKKIKIKIPPTT